MFFFVLVSYLNTSDDHWDNLKNTDQLSLLKKYNNTYQFNQYPVCRGHVSDLYQLNVLDMTLFESLPYEIGQKGYSNSKKLCISHLMVRNSQFS